MKPILFNTEMVRAILAGRKTETRRLIKPQPKRAKSIHDLEHGGLYVADGKLYRMQAPRGWNKYTGELRAVPVAPYKKGDVLYVRETWGLYHQEPHFYVYKADSEPGDEFDRDPSWKWRPSIHMPKEAARIFLRVTDVRLERLQEITDHGARLEGIGDPKVIYYNGALKCDFAELWNSTIKPENLDSYGWAANPWVWVIAFERCEKGDANA